MKVRILRVLSAALLVCLLLAAAHPAAAAELPQDHEYQRVLRQYLSTLTEKDFDHGVTEPIAVVETDDAELRYRTWLLGMSLQPIVGSKRGYPSTTAPARLFLLSAIEGGEEVMQPPVWSMPLAWLATWDYPGNPYRGSRALKMRAFVHNCVDLMMLDHQIETTPEKGGNRPDWFGPRLIQYGYSHLRVRDVVPAEARQAFEVGLRKMGQRQLDWAIKREEPNNDMAGAVGLVYVSQVLGDAEFTRAAETHVRRLLTDPTYFHPAGYFVDKGGIELGFGGMASFLANWAALASDWPFAREAAEKYLRLRAHLVLPEPEGPWTGPNHFNSRLDGDGVNEQWDWGFRHNGAAMVSDEAVHLATIPTEEELTEGINKAVGWLNFSIAEISATPMAAEDIKALPWRFTTWPSWNFPVVTNYAHDHARPDAWAHLQTLKAQDSPWLRSPFLRGETFVRTFDSAFTVVRMPSYAAVVHSGPVGQDDPNDGLFHFKGALGFGGGQLSAFWTEQAGPVLLGRRGGLHYDRDMDPIEKWRLWPIHAVSGRKGQTEAGLDKVFTSARIVQPEVTRETRENGAVVRVSGIIPPEMLGQGKVLEGALQYAREFDLNEQGVTVRTSVRAYGQDTIDEMYETLPVHYQSAKGGRSAVAVTIEFQVNGQWVPATAEFQPVTAVRVTRFNGAIQIAFDQPRRVKLSPEEWRHAFTGQSVCRNVMIDLLDNNDQPLVLNGEKTVSYTITAAEKP